MKKIFTLIAMCAVAATMQAAITIHVQASEAPYLWAWNAAGNLMTESWPGHQMTDVKIVQGQAFFTYTFGDEVATPIAILFNNGAGKQTGDIGGITTDRFFTYDGESTWTDVTEQYGGVVPDAEVTTLTIAGNHNAWGADLFDVVEAGKTFRLHIDLTDVAVPDDMWFFKIRPNGQDWVGFAGVTFDGETPEWIKEAASDGNFEIDLEAAGKEFTFTATWGGGKQAGENWTFKAEKGNTAGIGAITTTTTANGAIYNLAGQKVGKNNKGIVIQNGRKFVQK